MFGLLTRPTRFLPRGLLDVLVQFAIVLGAYEAYRLSRGAIDDPLTESIALQNADWIVRLEQALHLDVERAVQAFSEQVPGLPELSSFLYINVQTTVSFSVLAYIYVRHADAFGFVRTTFILTWGLAIIGFVLWPTMPPRLVPGLGIHDSVATFTGVDPSSRAASKFYNPYAAVPSLHVGVATLVGGSMALLAHRRAVRIVWALYPVMVTFLVLATGNHYLFDAAAGVLTTAFAAVLTRQIMRLRSTSTLQDLAPVREAA